MVPYKKVFENLDKHQVRYLIAGGFAVNFHQVQRATVDLDLIVDLEPVNVRALVESLTELGYRPRAPVNAVDFADEKKRREWIDEKGMLVFTFVHSNSPFEVIDIFSEEPIPFEDLWDRRFEVEAFNLRLPVVGRDDLIELKRRSGRDKDEFDIRQLQKIRS